jgi:DNA polymerase III subunit delta
MSKPAATFYVLHGDDDLRVEEEAQTLRTRMDESPNASLNTSFFDGTSTEIGEMLGAALAYPFLSDMRLVIVKDLLTHLTRKGAGNTGKKALETLLAQLPELPDWSRFVMIERRRIDEKNKVVQLARTHERGSEKLCIVPKDSTQWIMKRAQEAYSTAIEARAASALAAVTGSDLRAADGELCKLALYVSGERAITEADVALLTPYVSEASMFDMVDALAEGRVQAASVLVHRLLDQQEDPISLYGMIIRQFRLLLLAKEHLIEGGSPKALAEVLGIHPYPAEKVARQSRLFTVAQLERIYRLLQDYDHRMKTGRIEALLALDLLVSSLGR